MEEQIVDDVVVVVNVDGKSSHRSDNEKPDKFDLNWTARILLSDIAQHRWLLDHMHKVELFEDGQ